MHTIDKAYNLYAARRSDGVQRRPEERRHRARLDHEGAAGNRDPGSQPRGSSLDPREDRLRRRRLLRQKQEVRLGEEFFISFYFSMPPFIG